MSWVVVAGAAVTIGTTVMTNQANKKAAKTANEGEVRAAELANEGIDKQIGAIKQGIAEGDTLYGGIREETQPGVNYVRNIIAAPADLTPEQIAARNDLRRRVENSANVAGSALRGSGRSFVDAMREVENDFNIKALGQNRARADQAALEFVRPNFNAAGDQASAHATMGREVGGALANQGANLAGATQNAAYNSANATTSNANNWGSAIGDIAGTIASQKKEEARPAKYNTSTGDYTPGPGGF